MNFVENIIDAPLKDRCEVLVAGGGVAGISAALSARRQGADVLLVENSYILGGLATSGLVTIYLPLCDGMGRQISFGIAEELLRLSVNHFAEEPCPAWLENGTDEDKKKNRFRVTFNPHMFALEAEKLLLDEGVKILYGTRICGVKKSGDKISHVIIDNKSGFGKIEVKSVVDATGDADICCFAGEEVEEFQPKNTLAAWYYHNDGNLPKLKMLGFAEVPDEEKKEDNPKPLLSQRFTGIDGGENSKMVQLAHKQILADVINKREKDKDYVPVTIPTIPQLRMTRGVKGKYKMGLSDEHKYFETSIGMISNWRTRGPVYEVPFETLYGNKVSNLICAGRNVSATDVMWDIIRVIPPCAVMGQAAGIAATMTDDFATLDVAKLQAELVKNGVILHEKDL